LPTTATASAATGFAAVVAIAITTAASPRGAGPARAGGFGGFAGGDADDGVFATHSEEAAATLPNYLDVDLIETTTELSDCAIDGVFDGPSAGFGYFHFLAPFQGCCLNR